MCFSYTDIVCINGNFCATHAHNCGDVQSKTQGSKMMRAGRGALQSTQHMSETPNVSRPFSTAVQETTTCFLRRRRHLCTPEPAEPQGFAAICLGGHNHSPPPAAAPPS